MAASHLDTSARRGGKEQEKRKKKKGKGKGKGKEKEQPMRRAHPKMFPSSTLLPLSTFHIRYSSKETKPPEYIFHLPSMS